MSIPVRTIWWPMLYTSGVGPDANPARLAAEDLPEPISDPVAEVLARAVEQRRRRQLSPAFLPRRAVLSRVRGRIDHLTTVRHHLLAKGRVPCRFEELRVDSPRNRWGSCTTRSTSRDPSWAHPHRHGSPRGLRGSLRRAIPHGWRNKAMTRARASVDASIGAFEAKTQLSRLLRAVENGERFTITVRGKPGADLVPHRSGKEQGLDAAALRSFPRIHGVCDADVASSDRPLNHAAAAIVVARFAGA